MRFVASCVHFVFCFLSLRAFHGSKFPWTRINPKHAATVGQGLDNYAVSRVSAPGAPLILLPCCPGEAERLCRLNPVYQDLALRVKL